MCAPGADQGLLGRQRAQGRRAAGGSLAAPKVGGGRTVPPYIACSLSLPPILPRDLVLQKPYCTSAVLPPLVLPPVAGPGTSGTTPRRRGRSPGRTAGGGGTAPPPASSTPRRSPPAWTTRRAPLTPQARPRGAAAAPPGLNCDGLRSSMWLTGAVLRCAVLSQPAAHLLSTAR